MSFPPSLARASPEVLQEFKDLVDGLYSTRDPAQISNFNDQLQKLQKSEYAFGLAADLFSNATSEKHKYLAALTVALKSESSLRHVDEETNVWVVRLLLQWFGQSVEQDESTWVLQRICSTIVTVFMTTRIQWQNCLKDVFVYLASRDMSKTLTTENVDLVACIKAVSDTEMAAILIMFITLADQCRKQPHTSTTDNLHRRVSTNHGAVVVLLTDLYNRLLLSGDTARGLLPCYANQVLKCHLVWMRLYQVLPIPGSSPTFFTDHLSPVLKLLEQLPDSSTASHAASTFEAACELLQTAFKLEAIAVSEMIRDQFGIFLGSRKATLFLQMDDGGDYYSDVCFNRMVLAYCKRQYRILFLKPNDESRMLLQDPKYRPVLEKYARTRAFVMDIAQQVSSCLARRSLEEDLAMEVVGFWEHFAQDTRDYLLKAEARTFVLNIIDAFCRASAFHVQVDDDAYDFYDEADNEVREDVRSRTRDLLQVCCEEYGLAVFEKVLDSADAAWRRIEYEQHRREAYAELEPSVYFLVELAESLRFASSEDSIDGDEDAALGRLFRSPWFAAIFRSDLDIPNTLRKLALRTIGDFKLYFGFHKEELWRALDLLIEQMSLKGLAAPAAVSLRNLCDENRSTIAHAGRLEPMLGACAKYFMFPNAQREAKCAIVAAVASAAEAMPRPEATGEAANRLLTIIASDHERRMAVAQTTGTEAESLAHVVARDTLSLMVAMGRASQAKDDFDDLSERQLAQLQAKRQKYWSSEKAIEVRVKIAELLRVSLDAAQFQPDTISLASFVLQSGYRERLPGPFVFPPSVTIDFINSMPSNPATTLTCIKLVAELTSSQSAHPDLDAITATLTYTLRTVDKLSSPSSEPELAAACVDVAERSLSCLPVAVLSLDENILKLLLQFSLGCLEVPEPLPKRAGASFWQMFLSQVENAKVSVVAREKLRQIVEYVGGALMTAFVVNFAGTVSRNELNKLVEPFRMLVSKYPKSKEWLMEAVESGAGSLPEVTAVDRKRFADSIILLRGGTKTRTAVMDFWGKCKGAPAGYA